MFMGGKTEIHHHGSAASATYASGEIPRRHLEDLDAVFVESPAFAAALDRLREERVLVLAGAHATGRHAAALERRTGWACPPCTPSRKTSPATLSAPLTAPGGHVLRDLPLSRNRPLRDIHLHVARDQLKKVDGYLVVTVEELALPAGRHRLRRQPPEASAVVRAVPAGTARGTRTAFSPSPRCGTSSLGGTIGPPRRPSSRRRWRVTTAARRPRPGSRSSGRRPWSSSAGSG